MLKLLNKVEDRMHLYFFGKNINNIKFKYNTKKMVVLNRLPFKMGQYGTDSRLIRKILKRRKKSRAYLQHLKSRTISNLFLTDKQRLKLINRIFRSINKNPECFTFFYKLKSDLNSVNLKNDIFIVSWYSQKAALKKLLLAIDFLFEDYEAYKAVFVISVEFQYWFKDLNIEISFQWNRVRIIIWLTIDFKKNFNILKNLYIERKFKEIEDYEYDNFLFWYKNWSFEKEDFVFIPEEVNWANWGGYKDLSRQNCDLIQIKKEREEQERLIQIKKEREEKERLIQINKEREEKEREKIERIKKEREEKERLIQINKEREKREKIERINKEMLAFWKVIK